ncbi:MAG: hypothetical protein GY951_00845 [Psychromonas sp.]|nr:hypothetical protein [Psychromonas sp.]
MGVPDWLLPDWLPIGFDNNAADYVQQSPLSALCLQNAYWGKFNSGGTDVAGGALLRPLDMMKLGQLMLNDGKWKGKQLINRQWILDSMNKYKNPNNELYGLYWWHADYYVNGKTYQAVLARGDGGQNIVIIKELALVVVKTASNYDMSFKIDEMMPRYIIPAFVE